MSHFYGIVNLQNQSVSLGHGHLMEKALATGVFDQKQSWQKENAVFGHITIFNTPESLHVSQPLYDAAANLAIVADVRLDNREQLQQLLDLKTNRLSDVEFILKAYQKWGKECSTHLKGAFAFVIWDANQNELFLSRDHLGIKFLYYHFLDGQFTFATAIKGITSLPNIHKSVNDEWIAQYIVNVREKCGETIYQNIYRILPAHNMVINANGIRKWRYFQFDPDKEIRLASDEEYIEAFKEKFEHAIRVRLRSQYPIGAELSGGLDSSAIDIIADRMLRPTGQRLSTFSNVLAPSYDQKELIDEHEMQQLVINQEKFADHHPLDLSKYNGFDIWEKQFSICGEPNLPRGGFYASGSISLYETAQTKNIRSILSGFGGDEVVSSNSVGYTKELFRNKQFYHFFSELAHKKKKSTTPWYKWWPIFLLKEFAPTKYWKFRNRNKPAFKQSRRYHFANDQFARDYQLATRRAQAYQDDKESYTNVRQRQLWGLHHELVITRIEATELWAKEYGMSFRYPMLDVDLVDFALALPIRQKARKGWGRYLFRMAMEGILPPRLQWQKAKPLCQIIPSVPQVWEEVNKKVYQSVNELRDENFLSNYFNLVQLKEADQFDDKPNMNPSLAMSAFRYTLGSCYELDLWRQQTELHL